MLALASFHVRTDFRLRTVDIGHDSTFKGAGIFGHLRSLGPDS